MKYDLKNVTDLMRYLLPKPPVPVRWRRRMQRRPHARYLFDHVE